MFRLSVRVANVLIIVMSMMGVGFPQSAAAEGQAGVFIDVPTYVQQRNLSCEYRH